jgi:predicted DNA-binding ribbon-helix-helix protein
MADWQNVRRFLTLQGWRASAELEPDFWDCLDSIAKQEETTVDQIAYELSLVVEAGDLSAALRVFVLAHFRRQTDQGQHRANEGIVEGISRTRLAFRQKYH